MVLVLFTNYKVTFYKINSVKRNNNIKSNKLLLITIDESHNSYNLYS